MKNLLIIALAICTSKIAFSQTPLMEAYVGQPNQIKLNLPTNVVGNSGKCNIDVEIPGTAIYGQEVEAPNFEFNININPQQIGNLTVKWEGKTKFRGLGTVMGCPGAGSFEIAVKHKINQAASNSPEPIKTSFNWVGIGGNDTGDYFYDTTGLTGEPTNRTIFIKANIKTAGADGTLSRLLKYSVNCNDGTIIIESMKNYTASNLQGQEKDIKLSEGRARNKPNPNTLGASYVSNACNAPNLNQAKTDTNNANRQTPLSSWPNTTASVPASQTNSNNSNQVGTVCPPEKTGGHASLQAAINAANNKAASCVRGNNAVANNLSINPRGPREGRYEVMTIEGFSPQTQRLYIQIFSDGEASIISNGGGRLYPHKGGGVFINGNDVISIDEKSRVASVNGNLVADLKIVKKEAPDQSNITYGKKLNFPRAFEPAKNRTDLIAACYSASMAFLEAARGTAFKTAPTASWAFCTQNNMRGDMEFNNYVKNWKSVFGNGQFEPGILNAMLERCEREFVVLVDARGRCM